MAHLSGCYRDGGQREFRRVGEGQARVRAKIGPLSPTVIAGDARVLPAPPPTTRALPALRPGLPITAEAIIDALWG